MPWTTSGVAACGLAELAAAMKTMRGAQTGRWSLAEGETERVGELWGRAGFRHFCWHRAQVGFWTVHGKCAPAAEVVSLHARPVHT